jgi:hypothetical protein
MSQVSLSIDAVVYLIDSELVDRANAYRLPDNRVMAVRVWSVGNPRKRDLVEQTTSEALWANLPILEIDDGRSENPRFLVGHLGRRYEARHIPWTFSRTPDTGKVLYILWRDAAGDEKNRYIPFEVSELYYHQQLFELLPLAVTA